MYLNCQSSKGIALNEKNRLTQSHAPSGQGGESSLYPITHLQEDIKFDFLGPTLRQLWRILFYFRAPNRIEQDFAEIAS